MVYFVFPFLQVEKFAKLSLHLNALFFLQYTVCQNNHTSHLGIIFYLHWYLSKFSVEDLPYALYN